MLIWLIRHGETELNARRCYQGRLDSPLSAAGRAALREAAMEPQKVYITNTQRTAETAARLFPRAGREVIPDLREMDFGIFEGRSYQDMEQDAAYRAWVDGGCLDRCPGGEMRAEFSARVCAAFTALVERSLSEGREQLVIVAHGGTQMAVLERWGRPTRDYYAWCLRPGGGWLLDTANWPESLAVLEEQNFAAEARL